MWPSSFNEKSDIKSDINIMPKHTDFYLFLPLSDGKRKSPQALKIKVLRAFFCGAAGQIRTADLILTKHIKIKRFQCFQRF